MRALLRAVRAALARWWASTGNTCPHGRGDPYTCPDCVEERAW